MLTDFEFPGIARHPLFKRLGVKVFVLSSLSLICWYSLLTRDVSFSLIYSLVIDHVSRIVKRGLLSVLFELSL